MPYSSAGYSFMMEFIFAAFWYLTEVMTGVAAGLSDHYVVRIKIKVKKDVKTEV